MSEMIERIAPLVYAAMWPNNDPAIPWSAIQNEAAKAPIYEATRAVIAAMREPTQAMIDATGEPGVPDRFYRDIYTDMIDAALGAEAASPAAQSDRPREPI